MAIRIGRTTRIVLGIYLPSALVGFGQGMIVPTVPDLASSFDVPPSLAAQIVTAQLVGRTAAMIPAGLIVDRLGRRQAMVGGALAAIAAASGAALAPTFAIFLIAVGVLGFGETVWVFGREIAAIDQVRPEQRARMLSSFFGVGAVGVAFGPVAGGLLTSWLSYRAVFAAFALMMIVVLLLALYVKERRERPKSAAHAGISLAILREIEPGFQATFFVLLYSTFASMLRSTAVHSMLPIYAGAFLGFSSAEVGLLFGIAGLVTLVCMGPAGIVSDKIGRKWGVVPAATLAGLSFVAYFFARDMLTLSIASVILGLSAGLATGSNTTYTYDIIPAEARGRFQALRRSVGEVGAFSGPLIGGLVASAFNPGVSFLVFAPVHFTSALLLAVVARESLASRRATVTST